MLKSLGEAVDDAGGFDAYTDDLADQADVGDFAASHGLSAPN